VTLGLVSEYGCGCFSSVFYAEIYQNDVFLFFFKLFLRSAHQNDSKHIKKLIFSKKTKF